MTGTAPSAETRAPKTPRVRHPVRGRGQASQRSNPLEASQEPAVHHQPGLETQPLFSHLQNCVHVSVGKAYRTAHVDGMVVGEVLNHEAGAGVSHSTSKDGVVISEAGPPIMDWTAGSGEHTEAGARP